MHPPESLLPASITSCIFYHGTTKEGWPGHSSRTNFFGLEVPATAYIGGVQAKEYSQSSKDPFSGGNRNQTFLSPFDAEQCPKLSLDVPSKQPVL